MAKILLVEDNELNRDMLERRLVRRGYEVVVAVDGVDGIEKAKASMPDLILMDMGLPVMDGYEATRLLKENEQTRAIPILGLSAHAMTGAAEQALQAGCDDYDTKPVEVKRLMGKMQVLLERARENQHASASQQASEGAAGPPPAPDDADRSPHILIATGDGDHADVLCRRLTALGCTYEVASDGAQALSRLAAKHFSAVLLATDLGERNGSQVLESMHGEERLRQVPVLVLGADGDEEVLRALGAGAQDYLTPPFRREVVEARVRACLDRHAQQRREELHQEELGREKRRSDRLFKALMPDEVITELRTTRAVRPRRIEGVAILSCHLVHFHHFCDTSELEHAFGVLQKLTEAVEDMAQTHQLEPLRVGGDAFCLAAGLAEPVANPVLPCVRCALEMQEALRHHGPGFSVQAGIHVGPVMAGLVGRRKFRFNLWGETVHRAKCVEGSGARSAINLSATAWQYVAEQCRGESLGKIPAPEIDEIEIYRVDALH